MTNVRISTDFTSPIIISVDKSSQEIHGLVEQSGFPATAKIIGTNSSSPVQVKLDVQDIDSLNFFKEILLGGPSEIESIPELQNDPRIVSVIDSEGFGIVSEKIDDHFKVSAYASTGLIFEGILNESFDGKGQLAYIRKVTETLTKLSNFLESTFPEKFVQDNGFNNTLPTFTPVEEPAPVPQSKNSLALDKALDRFKETPVFNQYTSDNRNGYFFVKDGEMGEPLMVKISGDCERLFEMGYLELIRQKYSSDITIENIGRYRALVLTGKARRNYMSVLRSVLVDANIAGNYAIESIDYDGLNADVNGVFL